MALKVVGIAEMIISNNPDDVLVTYSLGSCVGATFYAPSAQIGGMIHCMLPLSKIDLRKAQNNPYMFTDTGVVAILTELFKMGVKRDDLIVNIAGAASLLDSRGVFKIGERNYVVLRKILWKNNLLINDESVKGTASRTLTLYMSDGKTSVKTSAGEKWMK